MSQEAINTVLDEIESQENDKVDFDRMVETIAQNQGVQENTAAAYIYQAEELEHKWTQDGDHIVREAVVSSGDGRQSVLLEHDDGDVGLLKMEAGDATEDRFEHLPVLEDVGHPLVPDECSYYRRRIQGKKTDIQVFTYDLARDRQPGLQHLLLKGLPGVGKNQAIKHICAKTNRPLVRIPVGGGIRYEDLVGHYSPTKDGELEWVDGILTTAVRYGYMVVLDEVDMMSGDISSPLHQITEDADSQELVIRQTGEVVKPHPEFRVAATRNPGFAGAKEMNDAFADRFSEHEVGFLNEEAEVKVLTNEVDGLSDTEIRPVVQYAGELRDRYPTELDLIVTTRALKRIGGYMAGDMFDAKDALKKVLLPRADPDTDRDPLADEIDMKF